MLNRIDNGLYNGPLSSLDDLRAEPRTLIEVLRHRALHQPDRLAYLFLSEGETEERTLSYEGLDLRARAISAALASAKTGQRALLLFPPGVEFIPAFFGCLYSSLIAVPAYPPDPARLNRSLPRLQAIINDAQPSIVLSTSAIQTAFEGLLAKELGLSSLEWLAVDQVDLRLADQWRDPDIDDDGVAFLQYTSGSTAAPKGVIVTHGNLMHNERMIRQLCEHTESSTFVGWLPLYHDMGLIANVLQPLYICAPSVLMSPVAFLQKPFRWLQAISRYQAHTSGGPNFAYDLCVRKISRDQIATLDLSSWKVAFNGAEPVRPATLEMFASAFASCGFRRETFYPCYGLAEATLIAAGGKKAALPILKKIKAEPLEADQIVEAGSDSQTARVMVGCGHSLPEQRIEIVDPLFLTRCAAHQVGEIWISGPSVAKGYWNRPQETAELFEARLAGGEGLFLRTGDLGFKMDGELFITGRQKDLIIIRGVNHYPQDIELSVEEVDPALRSGCGAAFAVEAAGEERLVVVLEVDPTRQADLNELIAGIRRVIADKHEIQVHAVALIKPGSIPKTSSGKIQRYACRSDYLTGALDVLTQWQAQESLDDRQKPASAASSEGVDGVDAWLISQIALRSGMDARQIDSSEPLTSYGIDSMAVIELAHGIEEAFGVSLSPSEFFASPSIAALASRIGSQPQSASAVANSGEVVSVPDVYHPLSRGQQSLWFLHELAPSSAAYNIAAAARINGPLDAAALQQAFQALVDRHSMLRATFMIGEAGPLQRINASLAVAYASEDASTWDQSRLNRELIEEANRPFDLQSGPVMRVRLLRLAGEQHILSLTVHHIVSDFWSMALLISELGQLYALKKHAGLPPPSAQYLDYARRQEELLASPEGERLWQYWQQQLSGELPSLDLPTDRPRPPVQTFNGATHTFKLDRQLMQRLKSVGSNSGVTLYMTLFAGLQACLYRHTGQREFQIGSVAAGRGSRRFAGVVGYFANPVVMRAALSDVPTFSGLLVRVRETAMGVFEHQAYPFGLLVERLQPIRDMSRSPLFQVMLVFHNAPSFSNPGLTEFALGQEGGCVNLGELTLESIRLDRHVAQFDLTLTVAETGAGLAASLEYNTDLFDASTIERMAGHYRSLLESGVADPQKRLSELAMLTEAERDQLVNQWNNTGGEPATAQAVHELFEAQAARSPDLVALACDAQQLSYAELNRRANQLGRYLSGHGVSAEVPVGVCLERSIEMVVALLGVLKAGGAYVPLDPSYPEERMTFIIEDTRMPVQLTQSSIAEIFRRRNITCVCLDEDWHLIEACADHNLPSRAGGESLAYVIYTSGSTGKPKGVEIEHRSTVTMLEWAGEIFGEQDRAGLLASTSICFDLSVFELFLPLSYGGKIVLARNALELASLAERETVRLVNTVPSAIAELARLDAIPDSVRTVCLAGEALRANVVEMVYGKPTVEQVFNLYGPSEDTTYSTFKMVSKSTEEAPTIGRPIAHTHAYVLDPHLMPVPIGVAGELHLAGLGLARGYLKRPELTAERFIPNPFSRQPGARLYRTGDLTRYLANGDIDYLGRGDHQVKLRGFRIELGEIESVLAQHPAIREAVVLVKGDDVEGKRLAAYAVAEDDRTLLASEMREFLQARLPDYMVPSTLKLLSALPQTRNGKLDRNALERIDDLQRDAEAAYAAPHTEVERALAAIWREALRTDRIGVYDNFFELGGHSLLMARLHPKVKQAFDADLTIVELFKYPTIHSLARYLSRTADEPATFRPAELLAQKRRQGRDRLSQKRLRRQQNEMAE